MIQTRRTSLGLTQEEAAHQAKISLATWKRLESADSPKPRASTARAVAKVLKLPASAITDPGHTPILELMAAGMSFDDIVGPVPGLAEAVEAFNLHFANHPSVTPRQAWAMIFESYADDDVARIASGELLASDAAPFRWLPRWVLFMVGPEWLDAFVDTFADLTNRLAHDYQLDPPSNVAESVCLAIMLEIAEETFEDEVLGVTDLDLTDCGDRDRDWGGARHRLLGHVENLSVIWSPAAPREILYSNTSHTGGGDLSRLHPFAWWEKF